MSSNGKGQAKTQEALRRLPGVDRLLLSPAAMDLVARYGRALVVEALRVELDALRQAIITQERDTPMNATIIQGAREWLEALVAPTLQPVINASGVIIHTNLGRAPLSEAAQQAATQAAREYSNLEYKLEAGERGSRFVHAVGMLRRLTGAEDALVVNNNAAAVLLMLSALCSGQEVIISRSQLIEIGGGFRMPDVMEQSGARLVEVGTTNRTYLRDYQEAIGEETGALLAVHRSNFQIVGFSSEPELADLTGLAQNHGLPLLYDQGSGALLDSSRFGLAPEPTVQDALAAGADIVVFSGDKLLGGPQAGILCGRKELIARCRAHPLSRALRPDKLCLAALAATLSHYLVGEAEKAVPVWRMIAMSHSEIQELAQGWAARLQEANVPATIVDGVSTVGGGAVPGSTLATSLLAIEHPQVEALAAGLRRQKPAVVARIQEGKLLVDPRTVTAEQVEPLLEALCRLAAGAAQPG